MASEEVSLKPYLSLMLGYGIAAAVLYLEGYWRPFGVNVFEHVSLADVARHALSPMLQALVITLATSALSYLLFGRLYPPGGGRVPREQVPHLPKGQRLFQGQIWWIIDHAPIILGLFLGIGILVAVVGPEPNRWSAATAIIVPPFTIALTHVRAIQRVIPDPQWRQATLFAFLWMLGLSFSQGRKDAYRILERGDGRIVNVVASSLPLAADSTVNLVYLGLIGDHFVLLRQPSDEIAFVRTADDATLVVGSTSPPQRRATSSPHRPRATPPQGADTNR
jgi:hypothetical protein